MLIFEGIYLNIEPGWYPDPDGKPSDRYWDGTSWTDQTRPQISKIQQNNPAPSASPKSQKKSIGLMTLSDKSGSLTNRLWAF